MKLSVLLFTCAMSGGCADIQLSAYEARGPSRTASLYSLSDTFALRAVHDPRWDQPDITMEEILAVQREQTDMAFRERVDSPGFRSLCGLLNSYWGEWDRLIVVERFSWQMGAVYMFVAAGMTHGRITVVTNLPRAGSLEPGSGYELRKIRPDRSASKALSELAAARQHLPERFLYFGGLMGGDPGFYVLHDMTRDGHCFSIAICGPPGDPEAKGEQPAPPTYAQTARLVIKDDPPDIPLFERKPEDKIEMIPENRIYRHDGERGREIIMAGRTYEQLVARVWRALVGQGSLGGGDLWGWGP